jgi:Fe-S-cluster containining protein
MTEETLEQVATAPNPARLCSDDHLDFRCDCSRDCFTNCCRDVSIVLTPYDVLRMKRALGIDSSTFLDNYAVLSCTRNKKLPVVLLKMNAQDKRCPFITEGGCSIYAHRPWACRMYPLGQAQPEHPTATDHGFYFVIREEFCHGHGKGTQTVRDWIREQGIDAFEMMGTSFQQLMLNEFWRNEEPLSPDKLAMYLMACFDLDRFRRFVFQTRFLQLFEVHEDRIEALRKDDEELLEFAMDWLRFSLFNERTMRLKTNAQEVKREKPNRAEGATAPGH